MPLSEAQDLILRILERESFNNLNGSQVAHDLRANTPLWRSAFFTSIGIAQNSTGDWLFNEARHDLISLRDLPNGFLHFDTLLLLPTPGAQDALEKLVSAWSPNIVEWVGIDEAARVMGGKRSVLEFSHDPGRVLLYTWWD